MVMKVTILEEVGYFLSDPESHQYLAELSRRRGIPHPSLRKRLNFLVEAGLLKREYKGKQTLYYLNLDNANIIDYLTIAEKDKLIKRCEEEIRLKELVNFIHDNTSEDNKVILFGSATEKLKTAEDIDVLITGKHKVDFQKLQDKLNKEIEVINVLNLNKVSESLKKEILKKHLIIKGSEEIVKWLIR